MNGDIYVVPYFPNRVRYIITTSGNHYISFVNKLIILKYLYFKGTSAALYAESRILQQLSKHPRIIEFKGEYNGGLLLEYTLNGSLEKYLRET